MTADVQRNNHSVTVTTEALSAVLAKAEPLRGFVVDYPPREHMELVLPVIEVEASHSFVEDGETLEAQSGAW